MTQPRHTADHITDDALDALYAELAALRAVARGYCGHCGRGDCSPTADQWYEQRTRADKAEEALEKAQLDAEQQDRNYRLLMNERTSYREAWKYEQKRRAKAEAAVNAVRRLHVRNEHTGACEECSQRDYPDYSVPHPCPTLRALDAHTPTPPLEN